MSQSWIPQAAPASFAMSRLRWPVLRRTMSQNLVTTKRLHVRAASTKDGSRRAPAAEQVPRGRPSAAGQSFTVSNAGGAGQNLPTPHGHDEDAARPCSVDDGPKPQGTRSGAGAEGRPAAAGQSLVVSNAGGAGHARPTPHGHDEDAAHPCSADDGPKSQGTRSGAGAEGGPPAAIHYAYG